MPDDRAIPEEPSLNPRIWASTFLAPAAPAQTLSRAEVASAAIEQLAQSAGPGERIGSKDDLRELTSVSVGTLNEALKIAQARGVVTLRRGPGGGIFAANVSSLMRLGHLMLGLEGDSSTASDALRMRNALDPLILSDALEHSSAADVADLRAIIERMRDDVESGDIDSVIHGHWEFQARVSRISPYPLMRNVFVSLLGILDEQTVAIRTIRLDSADDIREHFAPYVKMADALEAHDRDGVFEVMRNFIDSQK